ncbi:MAG: ABC transporter permease [Bacteroidales bacterium]|nr:ABC transporter permease [Bacteroidales bacterium]
MIQLLKYDIILQWRQRFWLIYIIISILYTLVLLNIDVNSRYLVSVLLVLSDTTLLGLIFVGAIILLEKQQNLLQSIFVTPLRLSTYLLSKGLSLVTISLVMSLVIVVVPNGVPENPLIKIVVIILSSLTFTFIGIALSTRVTSVNDYIGTVMLGTFWIIIPVIPFLMHEHLWWLIIFPVNAAIELLIHPVQDVPLLHLIVSVASMLSWCIFSFSWAHRRFLRHVIRGC